MRAICGMALALAVLPACGEDDPAAAAGCREDFDCAFNELCEGASGDAEGTCTAAADGTPRTFAAFDLDFSGGTESYLLAVYALPTGEAATSSDLSTFSIVPASAALTVARAPSYPAYEDPTFAARSAFERTRRAHIDAQVSQLRAGKQLFQRPGRAVGSCPLTSTTCEYDFVNSGNTITADEIVAVTTSGGRGVRAFLDQADGAATTEATAVANAFAGTLDRVAQILGVTQADWDRNGDGYLTIVFTSDTAVSTDVVGAFDVNDFLAASAAGATGNEADILWARVPGTSNTGGVISEDMITGTLVHEVTHLASYAERVYRRNNAALREALWLDEGMAHLMEDLSGWGGSNIGIMAPTLGSWNDSVFAGPDDTIEQRGKAYSFLRFIIDHRSSAANAAGVSGGLISELIDDDAVGFTHGAFSAELVGAWQRAIFTSGADTTAVSYAEAHVDDYKPVAQHSDTGYLVGLNPYGDTYVDARGDAVPSFAGPDFIDAGDPATSTDLADATLAVSGTVLYVVSGGTGTVSLRGTAGSGVDLHVFTQRIH